MDEVFLWLAQNGFTTHILICWGLTIGVCILAHGQNMRKVRHYDQASRKILNHHTPIWRVNENGSWAWRLVDRDTWENEAGLTSGYFYDLQKPDGTSDGPPRDLVSWVFWLVSAAWIISLDPGTPMLYLLGVPVYSLEKGDRAKRRYEYICNLWCKPSLQEYLIVEDIYTKAKSRAEDGKPEPGDDYILSSGAPLGYKVKY